MKLTLEGLKEKSSWEAVGVALPSYDVASVAEETKKAPVWVHFGAGNIFRWLRQRYINRLLRIH